MKESVFFEEIANHWILKKKSKVFFLVMSKYSLQFCNNNILFLFLVTVPFHKGDQTLY